MSQSITNSLVERRIVIDCSKTEEIKEYLEKALKDYNPNIEYIIIDSIDGSRRLMEETIKEQYLINKNSFESNIFRPDPHPHGWYRKFEKKRF